MKDFKELQFSDDFMFGKVMEDPVICKKVLETLLQRKINELKPPSRQGDIKVTADGHAIRLDIVTMDDVGNIYDAEMQNANNSVSKIRNQLPKRSRYYQAMLDQNFQLDKGADFSDMKECNIIFICTFDPFGEGKYVYTIKSTCVEMPLLNFKDDVCKIFFNTTADLDEAPEDVKNLLRYIQNNEINDQLTGEIQKKVVHTRLDGAGRNEYMKTEVHDFDVWNDGHYEGLQEGLEKGKQEGMQEGLEKGKQEGILEGKQEGEIIFAYKMVKQGAITLETAASMLGMDSEEILIKGKELLKNE